MKDEKSILYKKDYVPSHKTDIRKTFAKILKEQKKNQQVSTVTKTQPDNIVQYKKFKG
jgi:hypothetical protein